MKALFYGIICCALFMSACSTLVLQPADFSWPVEVVLKADAQGNLYEQRYQVGFNIKPLVYEEFGDSLNFSNYAFRVIRDARGYYFITGKQFKHVYIFKQADGSLQLDKQIKVSETGLADPALNQKKQHIELIDEKNPSQPPITLTREGLKEGGK